MYERIVDIGTRNYTKVVCRDKPGLGNACHEYQVLTIEQSEDIPNLVCSEVHFQNGPIKENGVNGCYNEDLIAIVLDRLYGFQSGVFKCRENAIAITKLEEALHWLKHRTDNRIKRGVEGTNVI